MSATLFGSGNSAALARAFNLGCDARLDGDSRNTNPYDELTQKDYYRNWFAGWDDIEKHWPGKLPEVA